MMSPRPEADRTRGGPTLPWKRAARVLALLLLVLRAAVPAHVPPNVGANADGRLAIVLGDLPICHAEAPPAAPPADPGDRPAIPSHDCGLCPACHLSAATAVLPQVAWLPAPPQARVDRAAPVPPSTGPPQPRRYAARPRGPPATLV